MLARVTAPTTSARKALCSARAASSATTAKADENSPTYATGASSTSNHAARRVWPVGTRTTPFQSDRQRSRTSRPVTASVFTR